MTDDSPAICRVFLSCDQKPFATSLRLVVRGKTKTPGYQCQHQGDINEALAKKREKGIGMSPHSTRFSIDMATRPKILLLGELLQ